MMLRPEIFVLISTLDERIGQVDQVLLPPEAGLRYVVCWQRTKTGEEMAAEEEREAERLQERSDVWLTVLEGKGLSRSRNHAMQTALALRSNVLDDAILVIADDDERLDADLSATLRTLYGADSRLDAALLRVRESGSERWMKRYPEEPTPYASRPRWYYPSSVELTLRCRVAETGFHFDERFGLGSDYLCAGEEDIFLRELQQSGLRVYIVPEVIGSTAAGTTGSRTLDEKALRSKGAVYGYKHSILWTAARSLREAVSLALRHRKSPIRIFRTIWQGVTYIRS
ncbi:MAG: hypothetical protein K6C30_01295 [Bacteroidaceae bacterium]|nr:hypothetical protein [Bacteroidaceae bacterium]